MAANNPHAHGARSLFARGETGNGIRLVSLAQLVRRVSDQQQLPTIEAVRHVVDAVGGSDAAMYFAACGSDDFALPVTPELVWRAGREAREAVVSISSPSFVTGRRRITRQPARSAVAGLVGREGALQWLRERAEARDVTWIDDASSKLARLAIASHDADVLFTVGTAAAISRTGGSTLAASNSVIDLAHWGVGVQHAKGVDWTDDERAAMFRMRHVGKLTDAQIAVAMGCGRTLVGHQIGSADSWKDPTKEGWKPSDELLAECDLKPPAGPWQSKLTAVK